MNFKDKCSFCNHERGYHESRFWGKDNCAFCGPYQNVDGNTKMLTKSFHRFNGNLEWLERKYEEKAYNE